MPWGTAPADEVASQQPVPDVAEDRVREIVREELAAIAARQLSDG